MKPFRLTPKPQDKLDERAKNLKEFSKICIVQAQLCEAGYDAKHAYKPGEFINPETFEFTVVFPNGCVKFVTLEIAKDLLEGKIRKARKA